MYVRICMYACTYACTHARTHLFYNLNMRDYHGELALGNQDTAEPALRVEGARKTPCTPTSTQMYMIDRNARYAVKRRELMRFKNCRGSMSTPPIHLIRVRPSTSSVNTDFGSARYVTFSGTNVFALMNDAVKVGRQVDECNVIELFIKARESCEPKAQVARHRTLR